MPEATACLPADEVRRWVAFDQDRFSIVASVLPPDGGRPQVQRIETAEKAIRRFVERQGGPEGLSVCSEPGRVGLRCGGCGRAWGSRLMVAPSLIPVGFHLNALSSGLPLNVDIDATLTVIADNLYRLLARQLPPLRERDP
jgi:hypothetical protein